MNLKVFFMIVLLAATIKAKSQDFLNNDSTQIKEKTLSKGALYRGKILQYNYEDSGRHYEMEFQFPKAMLKKEGVVEMTFFLNLKNNCFKYQTVYYGHGYKKRLTVQFNNPNSGLKQTSDSNWENVKEKYQLEILKNIPVNGKTNPVCILEIRKIDNN